MQYSPKLKRVMKEIEDLLKKEDIAGFVVLHTPGFSEYLNHLKTSYSCATIVGDGVRLKLNSKEVGLEKAKIVARDTLNMVTHLAKHLGSNALFYIDCEEMLKEKWGGDDLPDTLTSHSEQNN